MLPVWTNSRKTRTLAGNSYVQSEVNSQKELKIPTQATLGSLVPKDSWGKGSISYIMQIESLLKKSSYVSIGILDLWKDLQIGSNLTQWEVNKIRANFVDVTTLCIISDSPSIPGVGCISFSVVFKTAFVSTHCPCWVTF